MVNGKEMENSTMFSNYKKLPEGIVYPYNIGGGWGETEITNLTINPTLEESLFKPSTPPATAPTK